MRPSHSERTGWSWQWRSGKGQGIRRTFELLPRGSEELERQGAQGGAEERTQETTALHLIAEAEEMIRSAEIDGAVRSRIIERLERARRLMGGD